MTGRWPGWVGISPPSAWMRAVPRHLRERSFWIVQGGILGITLVHGFLEIRESVGGHAVGHDGLAFLPIVFYLAPIGYAGFVYGAEGAWLSGAWAALLAVPNMVLWHGDGFDWLVEFIYVLIVVTLGAVLAVPVERERRQRDMAVSATGRAEAAARRLGLLNEAAEALGIGLGPAEDVSEQLARILEHVGVEAGMVSSWPAGAPRPTFAISWGESRSRATLRQHAMFWHRDGAPMPAGVRVVPIGSGRTVGLLVAGDGIDHLDDEEEQLLTGVARQIGVARENADLQRREEKHLREHLRELTLAQEEERRHIARDLHDIDTHDLLLICRRLDQLTEEVGASDPALAQRLQEEREQVGNVIAHLRRFSRDLRPDVLENLGLVAALEWLAEQGCTHIGCDVRLEMNDEPGPIDSETELTIYRIVQEALRNVERHAQASQVRIRVDRDDERLRVVVTDDGVGFDEASVAERAMRGRLGLTGMIERAELVGGMLEVTATPGAGTSVALSVPIDR